MHRSRNFLQGGGGGGGGLLFYSPQLILQVVNGWFIPGKTYTLPRSQGTLPRFQGGPKFPGGGGSKISRRWGVQFLIPMEAYRCDFTGGWVWTPCLPPPHPLDPRMKKVHNFEKKFKQSFFAEYGTLYINCSL